MSQAVLDEIRVLELSDGIAAPYCAKMLVDCGAEVIRVEPPRPTARPYAHINSAEYDALELHLNANKKSVTIDLDFECGREMLLSLALRCDAVIESMEPGRVDGLGIGYDRLSASRPDMVMTSVTPFGQTGPYKDWDYTELTIFAMSGAMNREGIPTRSPLKYGGEIAQYFAGTVAAAATMTALVGAAMTGVGDYIDISILESMAGHPHQIGRRAPFAYAGGSDSRSDPRVSAAGGREPYAVGTFRCKDGYVSFLPLGPRMWPNIAEMIGRQELMDDPRFHTPQDRVDNRVELERIFQAWLDENTRAEVFDAAQRAGLPGGPVLRGAEVVENEHFAARDYFREMTHPDYGTLRYTGLPVTLSDSPKIASTAAPSKGANNREVLAGLLNLSDEEIRTLSAQGIV